MQGSGEFLVKFNIKPFTLRSSPWGGTHRGPHQHPGLSMAKQRSPQMPGAHALPTRAMSPGLWPSPTHTRRGKQQQFICTPKAAAALLHRPPAGVGSPWCPTGRGSPLPARAKMGSAHGWWWRRRPPWSQLSSCSSAAGFCPSAMAWGDVDLPGPAQLHGPCWWLLCCGLLLPEVWLWPRSPGEEQRGNTKDIW